MNQEILYSVKDVCDKYRITRKTLFYYDRSGLLKPTFRQGKQQFKYYNDEALTRLESILQYRNAGLSIEDIRLVIDENDKNEVLLILKKVKDRLIGELAEKEEEIRNLDKLIKLNS